MTPPSPWSRAQLLDRLQSYTASTWTVPSCSPINALECARHGWTCSNNSTQSNLLCCITCHRVWHIALGHNEPVSVVQALEAKYAAKLSLNHSDSCLWRTSVCSPSVYHVTAGLGFRNFRARLEKYIKQGFSDTTLARDVVFHVPTRLSDAELDSFAAGYVKAAVLSATGWTLVSAGTETLVTCDACLRRLLIRKLTAFDPEAQHWDYCAYLAEQDGVPAWKRVLSAFLNRDADLHSRVRHARSVIGVENKSWRRKLQFLEKYKHLHV